MKKKVVIPAVTVLVVAFVGFLGLRRIQRSSASTGDLQTAQVSRGTLIATINTAGSVETADSIDLSFQTSGQVVEVKVQEGDAVQAGQEIARLDDGDLQMQVSQAELTLDNARAQLDAANQGATPEEIASAQAALASAQESLKALQAGPSATDTEIARLQYEKAKDQLWSTQCQRDATCGNPNAGSGCDQANAAVAGAELSVEIARLQYEQAQQGPTAKDLRAAEAQVAQAQLNLSKLTATPANADIRSAENQVKQAELSLEQAKRNLAQCSLTAPCDGAISSLDLRVGQTAGPSTPAATLAGSGGLQITADMAEADVAKVKAGQEATIVLDAMPDRTFQGSVTRVANAGTSTQGVVNFGVTISLEGADEAVKPGMTANVTVVVDQREDVLLAPSRAIQVQGQQHIVRVLYEDQVIEVPVQVGLNGDNGTEILGDTLREGDVLVLNGSTTTAAMPRGIGGGIGGMFFGR